MIHTRPPNLLGFLDSESTTRTMNVHIRGTVLGFRLHVNTFSWFAGAVPIVRHDA